MTKKDRFVCWLPCKPYVKQFLLYNFNAPDDTWTEIVNLSPDKELQNDFLSRLAKPGRYENRYRNLARYTANVAVEIRRDDFYRYGWAMSNTEVVGSAARWKDGSSRCFSSISTPMSVSESHSRPPSATFRTASALMTTPGLMRLSAGSITGMDIGKRWRIPRF